MRLPSLPLIAVCLIFAASSASAELWRWVDANGVVRYTPNPDRIPGAARGSLARVEPGMAPAPVPAVSAAAPATPPEIYAPADEFSFEADPFNAPDQAQTLRGTEVPEPLAEGATIPLGADRSPSAVTAGEAAPSATPAPPQEAARAVAPEASGRPELDAAQTQRRTELLAEIERDEAAIKELISGDGARSGSPSDELRAIAERLPRLQEELRQLEGGASGDSGSAQQ